MGWSSAIRTRGITLLCNRHSGCHCGPPTAGFNFEPPTKLSKALSHAHNSDSWRRYLIPGPPFLRNAAAFVCDLQDNCIAISCYTDDGAGASRMAMNICQTFLRHAKQRGFDIGRETPDISFDSKFYLNPAPLTKTSNKPLQGRNKA